MYKLLTIVLISTACFAQAVKKSPVDLLREGRMVEAQRIISETDAPERYHLLLDALREPNAIEACFLYREISARFPGSDCDVFAQERLLQAASMGIDISALVLESTPSAEPGQWSDESATPYEVERPLIASTTKGQEPVTQSVQPEVKEALAPPTESKVESEPKPETELDTSPVEDKSFTLDYSQPVPEKSESDTVIKAAALTEEQKLIKPRDEPAAEIEKQTKPPAPRVMQKKEPERPHDVEPDDSGEWFIQVGAFGNHDNAHKFAARLRADGYKVVLVPRDNLLQVRVGSYSTKESGRAVGDKIKAKYDCPAVLVTEP
ncbi:MAG: SPOR domain-containing protein [Calditrichaeota bacterium]|nr:SPOR domain-containing protein [Calditrichota bacterium]MCB9391543.1 SPOR domain-containing protein [Calditrichota bacterium]